MKTPMQELIEKGIDNFLKESKPYFDYLSKLQQLKPYKVLMNIENGTFQKIEESDTFEEIEIKKIIEQIRQKHITQDYYNQKFKQ
jgi:hypothetical protein